MADDGEVVLADPGRQDAPAFMTLLADRGWCVESAAQPFADLAQPGTGRLVPATIYAARQARPRCRQHPQSTGRLPINPPALRQNSKARSAIT